MAGPAWLDDVAGDEADRLCLRLLCLALDIGRIGSDALDAHGQLLAEHMQGGGADEVEYRRALGRAIGRHEGICAVHDYVTGLVEQLHVRTHPERDRTEPWIDWPAVVAMGVPSDDLGEAPGSTVEAAE